MRAYSQDLRDRVLSCLERKERPTEIARRLEVSRGWVHQVAKRFKEGMRSSLPIGGKRRSKLEAFKEMIQNWIAQEPDLSLQNICQRLEEETALRLKKSALWHQLNKWGLTFKKNAARQRARASRRAGGPRGVASKAVANGRGAACFPG